uniref:Uncharacterized protein n=1 Tax=Heterorhabditis bacteriophora TaxID=37862 RepID=A0A1I7WJY7_HETBA
MTIDEIINGLFKYNDVKIFLKFCIYSLLPYFITLFLYIFCSYC